MPLALSEQQINHFGKLLERRASELRDIIHGELLQYDQEQYGELAGHVHDVEEQSVADLLVDVNLGEIDQHVRELQEIERAQRRVAMGGYGICMDCGEPIAPERLEAYPAAARCHDCQVRHERTHAQPGRPSL